MIVGVPMTQLLILDISGTYTQIHDEVWITVDEIEEVIERDYSEEKYRCIVIR